MTPETLISTIRANEREVHFPTLAPGSDRDTESRYFGFPWLEDVRDWPQYMGKPMRFVLQLDLASIPEVQGLPRRGLLSFFHSGDWQADNSHSAVFIQDTAAPGGLRANPQTDALLLPRAVTGWVSRFEHPHIEDLDNLTPAEEQDSDDHVDLEGDGVMSCTMGEVLLTTGVLAPERKVLADDLRYGIHNFQGDKLGGWPAWAQGNETPEDSNGDPMILVYQVDAEAGPHLGDLGIDDSEHPCTGIGHLWYSPKTGECAHTWACD